jgi:hypothetical protein
MHETPYPEIRARAFQQTREMVQQMIPGAQFWLADIDREALHAWTATWAGVHPSGYGAFRWDRITARYCRHPRNFQAALWADGVLCARKQNAPNPLAGEVIGIITAALVYYCAALEIPLLEISNPAPGLEDRYRAAGFTLAYNCGSKRYLARTLP